MLDAGFGVALLQEEGTPSYVVRLARNATFRRAKVRPLARMHKRRTIPVTPPDRVETWREDALLPRAEVWADLVRPAAAADGSTITVLAIHDPRHRKPLLLAASLSLAPRATRDCYRDRWPVEQPAKQMLGAARHTHDPCRSNLSYRKLEN